MGTSILLIGATGTVGSEVAKLTPPPSVTVRALVRSKASAAKLPKGVEPVIGDLRDLESLRRAFQGVRAALYVAPHEADEEQLTSNVVTACNSEGARLVYVGVHADGANRFTRSMRRFMYGQVLPHYLPKFRQAELVRQQVKDAVILMPTNFFQNDELFRDELELGRFPQPFSKPVNRVDVRDVAVAAMRALTESTVKPGPYALYGPESLTGDQCAKAWSTALGRPVFPEREQERIDAAITRALSDKKRDDFKKSYGVLVKYSLPTKADLLAQTKAILGRAPTSYDAYVRDVVGTWNRRSSRGTGLEAESAQNSSAN